MTSWRRRMGYYNSASIGDSRFGFFRFEFTEVGVKKATLYVDGSNWVMERCTSK
jgi:hypothetical protein